MLRPLLLLTTVALAAAIRLPFTRPEGHLVMMYGPDEDFSVEKMEPLIKWIERKERTRFIRLEVYEDPANWKVMQFLDKDRQGRSRCYQFPFFYNRKTGAVISGPTNYVNFENWALGRESKEQDSVLASQAETDRDLRITGLAGRKLRLQRKEAEKRIKAMREDMGGASEY